MSSVSLDIIEEFLRSTDVQVRKNALTALSTMDTDESAARLVETAFSDPDLPVRQRAELELTKLDGAVASQAADRIAAGLDVRKSEVEAYAMLARLTNQGWAGTRVTGTWVRRVLRALRLIYATRLHFFQRLRLAAIGELGIIALSLVVFPLLMLATGMYPALQDVLVWVFFSGLLAFVTVLGACLRSLSLREHFDTKAAVVVELLHTFLSSTIIGLIVIGFVHMMESSAGSEIAWSWVKVAGVGVGSSVAVRIGGFLVAGRFLAPWNRLLIAAVGTVFGCAAAIAGLVLAGALEDAPTAIAPNNYFFPFVLGAAALAFAAARLDAEPPTRAPFSRTVNMLALAAAAIACTAVVVWAGTREVGSDSPGATTTEIRIDIASPGNAVSKAVVATSNPMRIRFSASFPQEVDITVADRISRDLELRLTDAKTGTQVGAADDPNPPSLRMMINPGDYLLTVGRYRTLDQTPVPFDDPTGASDAKLPLDFILPLLADSLGHVRPSSEPYEVSVELNARRSLGQ